MQLSLEEPVEKATVEGRIWPLQMSTSESHPTCEYVTLRSKGSWQTGLRLRTLTWEMIQDYPGGPDLTTRVPQSRRGARGVGQRDGKREGLH